MSFASSLSRAAVAAFLVILASPVVPSHAADVSPPAPVSALLVDKTAADVNLVWDVVAADIFGNPESIDHYKVYRGTTPDFVPDKAGGTNLSGTAISENFSDLGAGSDGTTYFYLVSAVDASANEGNTRASEVTSPPVLSGSWTDTTIEVSWTAAGPLANVVGYNVYYGQASGVFDFVDDVGAVTSHSLAGLQTFVNWYISVVPYDAEGNEGPASNEHIDAVAGRVKVRAHDDDRLCWGASKCTPTDPNKIQRSDGFQLLVPTAFPEGDWTRVLVTFRMDSQLCNPPAGSNTTKCGSGNPCLFPPCNGGYNTCGDPWDRTAQLFVVLDESCVSGGGSCITDGQLELIHAVTPFGSDADPPDGTGVVPPRDLTLDVTPFAPQLTGTKYVGAHIGHFVQTGWRVTADFEFSERSDEASPKPPADGFQQVFFRGGGEILTPSTVDVPATAQQVYGRFFISGHGGSSFCDGGFDDGQSCANGCPGGSCQNCDEFCHRTHEIKVDGANAWVVEPWRSDCSPVGNNCSNWNACGFPSCTFSRAGWCPGYIACHGNDPCDQDIDLTHKLQPGGSHGVTWEIPINNGSWSKSLAVYWYEGSTESCGNGVREGSELCDGADTGSVSCVDEG
ncbi:MAG: peptide-N-glycosidase F-related protein, partial [Acidobacteriota bacterium]|nr:peptide-N-glycosidase F-related protein [Acidobacteriota bacterium]